MESSEDKNDIQKPFQMNDENLKSFTQKLNEEHERNKYKNAEPAENNQVIFDSNKCIICHLLAYDPVICQKCESAIMCRQCNEQMKKQQGFGSYKCPGCRCSDQPRNLNKYEIKTRNMLMMKCNSINCTLKGQVLQLEVFLKHDCQSEIICPQDCGKVLSSIQEGSIHHSNCLNSVVVCHLCSSSVKMHQIDLNLLQKIVQSDPQQYSMPDFSGQKSIKMKVQEIFNEDPQLSQKSSQKFHELGIIKIEDFSKKFQNLDFEFDQNKYTIKTLLNINLSFSGRFYDYTGMVCTQTNKPQGLGRAIEKKDGYFIDGSYKEGLFHGFIRAIYKDGRYFEEEWENGTKIQ